MWDVGGRCDRAATLLEHGSAYWPLKTSKIRPIATLFMKEPESTFNSSRTLKGRMLSTRERYSPSPAASAVSRTVSAHSRSARSAYGSFTSRYACTNYAPHISVCNMHQCTSHRASSLITAWIRPQDWQLTHQPGSLLTGKRGSKGHQTWHRAGRHHTALTPSIFKQCSTPPVSRDGARACRLRGAVSKTLRTPPLDGN